MFISAVGGRINFALSLLHSAAYETEGRLSRSALT